MYMYMYVYVLGYLALYFLHSDTCTYLYMRPHAGFAGWGIAWFINGNLIPELVVERGLTYTFIVYGGDDPSDAGNYHPFYITDSRTGGRLLNTQEEKDVRKYNDLFTYTCVYCECTCGTLTGGLVTDSKSLSELK